MNTRITFGHFLIRLGRFIRSLAVMVMKPDDLVKFGKKNYAKPESLEGWSRDSLLKSGLHPEEMALLEKVPVKNGKLLLLGIGGGREAISFAQMGFDVTGVDFIPDMVERAIENAATRGLRINGFVQELSNLDVRTNTYDIVWLSASMYSCVPTRIRRITMLKRIQRSLRPKGYFVCQFHWDTRQRFSRRVQVARKAFALITIGNLWYEKGDMIWGNSEFIHAFSSEDELVSEFKDGGFEVVHFYIPKGWMRGGAVMKKL